MSFMTASMHPIGCHCADCFECEECQSDNQNQCHCKCSDCQNRQQKAKGTPRVKMAAIDDSITTEPGKEHVTGERCINHHHVQTGPKWIAGVGRGSAKYGGMVCLCGRMVWDYVPLSAPSGTVWGVKGQWVSKINRAIRRGDNADREA
jgi:hypothetical protein